MFIRRKYTEIFHFRIWTIYSESLHFSIYLYYYIFACDISLTCEVLTDSLPCAQCCSRFHNRHGGSITLYG